MHLSLSWATTSRVQALATLQAGEAAPRIKLFHIMGNLTEKDYLCQALLPALISSAMKTGLRHLKHKVKLPTCLCLLYVHILSFQEHLAHAGATGVMARQLVVAWWKSVN